MIGVWQEWICLSGYTAAAAMVFTKALDLQLNRLCPVHAPAITLAVLGGSCLYGVVQSIRHRPPIALETAQVLVPALGLGAACGLGLAIPTLSPEHANFGHYMVALSFFHNSEFFTTALFNKPKLSLNSYLLNHSWAYGIALVMSCTEYALEATFAPFLFNSYISKLGLALTVSGELCRKLAMFTARHNFSHIIADDHEDNHVLVTSGIYSISRHPSYMGWFWWAVGTQLLLCNPICTVAYAFAAYKFFADRVEYEERTLLNFFQADYAAYQKRVGTGIPFVKGTPPTSYELKMWASQLEDKQDK